MAAVAVGCLPGDIPKSDAACEQLRAYWEFPCTEQGIRHAIALGGGPHLFNCDGPTTVTTQAEIVIDNDVSLDGEGNLTVDGNYDHLVFSVAPGITAELIGVTVSGGGEPSQPMAQALAILNEGALHITDSIVANNDTWQNAYSPAIYNSGVLTVQRSAVSDNYAGSFCGAIESTNSLTLIDSSVSRSGFGGGGGAICSSGSLVLINSAVFHNEGQGAAIRSDGTTTLINSTVSENNSGADISGIAQIGGTLTLISSTVTPQRNNYYTISLWPGADLVMANSLIVGSRGGACGEYLDPWSGTISGGGNIESPGDTCGLTDPTDLVNVTADDLKLGPLADNGGPTMTHALLAGSVAIDWIQEAACLDAAGDPLTTDQRGQPRPETGGTMCDVGAFERQPDDDPDP